MPDKKNDPKADALPEALFPLKSSGKGVLVGLIDSGIDIKNPAFKGAVKDYRFYNDQGIYDLTVEAHDPTGHGTVLAGIIAGRATAHWEGGIAQCAQLLVASSIESGNKIARILSALIWMLEEPVQIVNLSAGVNGWNPIFRPVIQALNKNGVLVVASIGNEGAGQFRSPGAYPEVLSVGAANESGEALSYSGSKNKYLTCLKPDVLGLSSITSIRKDGTLYEEDAGTSGAAAYVSGVCAQLMTLVPGTTAKEVAYALKTTGLPMDTNQSHRSQTGLIQLSEAANLLKSKYSPPGNDLITEFEYFRDERLLRQLKHLTPKQSVPVVLYLRPKTSINNFINKTKLKDEAINFLCIYEAHNYAIVTANKKQLEVWWENEIIIMISRA